MARIFKDSNKYSLTFRSLLTLMSGVEWPNIRNSSIDALIF